MGWFTSAKFRNNFLYKQRALLLAAPLFRHHLGLEIYVPVAKSQIWSVVISRPWSLVSKVTGNNSFLPGLHLLAEC